MRAKSVVPANGLYLQFVRYKMSVNLLLMVIVAGVFLCHIFSLYTLCVNAIVCSGGARLKNNSCGVQKYLGAQSVNFDSLACNKEQRTYL